LGCPDALGVLAGAIVDVVCPVIMCVVPDAVECGAAANTGAAIQTANAPTAMPFRMHFIEVLLC
jgi:hypothetical protein